ncbi:MAG: glycosyltransferase family 1 protein, partial [Candidatus Dadabacteria bacterium]
MIVAYDGIRAALNPSGLGNYSRFILDAVERHLPAIEPHVYLPLSDGSGLYQPQGRARLQHPHRWPGGLLARTLWRRRLARRVAADGAAVFHGLSNELPVRLHSHGLRGVVTIHDLIYLRYPQYFSAIDRRLYDRRYRRSVAEADRIIAVSQQTADDLMRYYGAPAGRIDVVGQGCAPFFYEIERRPAPQPLVLYVGAFDPRKNIALIVEAAARLQ